MEKWELKDSAADTGLPMRAKGNLSYLQFIDLVRELWSQAHPDIQIVTSGNDDPAKYPCIIYSLQLRKTHPSEPKMRYREERNDNGEVFVVGGQRFQNLVYFEAIGETQHVETVETLIEAFEDFMMEHTPVLKQLGVSELVYARRLSDSELVRPSANVVRRVVSYMVTTEKVIATRYDKLKEITVHARTSMQNAKELYAGGTIHDGSPRYHLVGPDAYLSYNITNADQASTFGELVFNIPRTNFRLNDTLWLMPLPIDHATPLATPESYSEPAGFFTVTNVVGNPYSVDAGYTLTRRGGTDPDVNLTSPFGASYYIPDSVSVDLIDSFGTL